MTSFDGPSFLKAGRTSGKYRVIARPPRLIKATSSPSRKTSVRKPSHLGSYSQPSPLGIPESEIAESIGSMSSGSGNFKLIPRCLYLVDGAARWYYIGGPSNRPPHFDSPPPPPPGKRPPTGFPPFC